MPLALQDAGGDFVFVLIRGGCELVAAAPTQGPAEQFGAAMLHQEGALVVHDPFTAQIIDVFGAGSHQGIQS
ncbi:Uncharacterised protein [Mycobacteroides abscessus subsp. abscessus]|nr:Uncharacterised protein [Mycobacteroides abscessus subsp. abscessus]